MSAQDLYETIVETTGALIVVLDPEGRIVRFNPACERVSGYRFEEVKGRHVWDFLLLPEETEGVKAVFRSLARGTVPSQYANHWITKSGERRWIEWSNSAVTDERGQVVHVIGTGIDVTDRRDAEAQLRENQERFQVLASAIPLVLWIRDPHSNRVLYVSPGFETIWGRALPDADTAFEVFRNSIHPDDREAMFRQLQEEARSGRLGESEYRIVRPDGEVRWIHSRAFPVRDERGTPRRIVGYAEDITDRKTIEQALSAARQRQKALLDSIPDAAWFKDRDGVYVEVNRAFCERHYRSAQEIVGRTDFELVEPEIARDRTQSDREVFRTRQPAHAEQMRIVNGRETWVDRIKAPVLDAEGKIIGTAGISRDITERKIAERTLRETQQRLKALFDNIPDVAWIKDADGRYVEVNPKFRERYGPDLPDPRGKSPEQIFSAEIAADMTTSDRVVLESGQPLHIERQRVIRGETRWIDVIKFPITDSCGKIVGIAGVTRDVTERKLAEAQRMARDAAQRDALVKEVHHRIKNNLQGVITLIQHLATGHPESASMLDAAITRLNTIATVHGLYGTTGDRELRLEQIVLRLVSSLKTLHADLPVQLSVRNPATVQVRENEVVPLALIVNELIMNAIKYSRATVDSKPVEVVLDGAGNCARIVIRNRGDRLPRHFNFDAGAGLGTGLSLVKSLLPPDGVMLHFESTADPAGVKVELTLSPPVITLSPSNVSSPVTARELELGAHSDR